MTDTLRTLEDHLRETSAEIASHYACTRCGQGFPAFALVESAEHGWHCGSCLMSDLRAAVAESEAQAREAIDRDDPWASELGLWVRAERNRRIDAVRWAVDRDTSPLTDACQEQYRAMVRQLHRVTVDQAHPGDVVWPEEPTLEYR